MIRIKLFDIEIEVDQETADSLLQDEKLALQYYELINKSYSEETEEQENPSVEITTNAGSATSTCCANTISSLWKSAKNITPEDKEATRVFLELRKKYDPQFKDKKTSKNMLWQKINNTMNEMGFYIGEGVIGRERCRQKFSNLQSSYLKARQRRKRTGEGEVILPPFYEELEELLADNHKVNPVLVVDTFDTKKIGTYTSSNSEVLGSCSTKETDIRPGRSNDTSEKVSLNSASGSGQSNLQSPLSNRFSTSSMERTVRPNKQNVLIDTIKNINKENQDARKAELQSILQAFNKDSDQRHKEVMALISVMSKKAKKGNKGNRSEESDDE